MRQISAFRRYCRRYRLLEHRQRPHRSSHYRHHHSHSHAMPHTVQNTPKITTFFDAFPQYLSLQNCTKHSSASIQHAPTFQTHRRSSTLSTSCLFLRNCTKLPNASTFFDAFHIIPISSQSLLKMRYGARRLPSPSACA